MSGSSQAAKRLPSSASCWMRLPAHADGRELGGDVRALTRISAADDEDGRQRPRVDLTGTVV